VTGLLALGLALTLGLPPVAPLVGGAWTPLLGLPAAVALFAGATRRAPSTRPRATLAFALTLRASLEELFWRGLVLAGCSLAVGAAGALALSSGAFACMHRRRRLHLLTGLAFGGLYVATGKLLAPILAHAAYNLLVCSTLPVAELRRARKRFGASVALDDVDLEVRRGEVLALVGPNGAGKSTALSLLLGLRRPDSGIARLHGLDPARPEARRAVGVVPQEIDLPPALRVREIVDLVRAHHADPEPRRSLVERFGLEGIAARQGGGLSLGERRRVALALAFAGRPRVLFLDEPSAGLDVESRRTLWGEVRGQAERSGAVLLTTHYLDEVVALADAVVVLAGGRVVAHGTVDEIRAGRPLEDAYVELTGR
jgi:ABC-2 type transport system ATP-binding protein